MIRIPPLDPVAAFGSEEAAAAAARMMGYIPNSLLTMAHWPELMGAMTGAFRTILGEGQVDSGLKRLIAHATSLAAGCRYCQAHTAHSSHEAGIARDKLAALHDFENADAFTPAERAVLALAFAAGAQPNGASDAHFERLREWFDTRQQVEIMAVIAMFGFLNRWNDTLATPLESAPFAFAAEQLAPHGWNPGVHGPAPVRE